MPREPCLEGGLDCEGLGGGGEGIHVEGGRERREQKLV